jgi:RNA polymerase-binding transcription factor DksA
MSLSSTQREHLAGRLREERARLGRDLDAGREEASDEDARDRAGDLSAVPFHPADLGTDTMDAELAASNASRISRELAEIDAALERLYRTPERFGICEDTGEPIPYERLEIVPWARTCREAEAHDRP